ncbi:hypothetical protein BD310DRAFT_673218 [Dichomitus squalens]|uniref:Uncharacterized protein n=1 Tax=Dichomitus squalens TaxID=114155 RepID=A0A4V2K7D3_9APHY|nr:hypothetical protein BD310DRAFT_673218 [Dichomitus squalens]
MSPRSTGLVSRTPLRRSSSSVPPPRKVPSGHRHRASRGWLAGSIACADSVPGFSDGGGGCSNEGRFERYA